MFVSKSVIKSRSGETVNKGAYVCQHCYFEIVSVKDNYVLPTCPCCESTLFAVYKLKDFFSLYPNGYL